jgi:D-arabinose 1-dehydrogenase-like Zn-dependent alcohol dehydrogenase
MRAVVMRSFGGPEVLEPAELLQPEPGPGEVRVRVAAVEVARTRDLATRSGDHPFSRRVTLPQVLGGECVGVVDAVGEGVDDLAPGTRVGVGTHVVCGHCRRCREGHDEVCENLRLLGIDLPGAYAELVVIARASVTPLPDGLDALQAGALAADGPVATEQLEVGEVGEGTRVLVLGAGGALGSTLVCLAAARGAEVWAISGRHPECLAPLPLAGVIPSSEPNVLGHTGGEKFDVVVDNLSLPDLFAGYWPALGLRGRIVISGAMSAEPLPVPARMLYTQSQSIRGVRSARQATIKRFWELVAGGFRLPAETFSSLPLEAAADAHRAVASSDKLGHLLLTPAGGDWPDAGQASGV